MRKNEYFQIVLNQDQVNKPDNVKNFEMNNILQLYKHCQNYESLKLLVEIYPSDPDEDMTKYEIDVEMDDFDIKRKLIYVENEKENNVCYVDLTKIEPQAKNYLSHIIDVKEMFDVNDEIIEYLIVFNFYFSKLKK